MFRKTKRKIVAAVMSILVLLWAGTLGVIYTSSYVEMKKQNEQMLRTQADMYTLPQYLEDMQQRPGPGADHGFKPEFDPQAPKFQLSTFYMAAFSCDGKLLELRNEPPTVYTDEELTTLARDIAAGGEAFGTRSNLSFFKADKNGYVLVVFMDNTLVNEGALTLFRYTLIFGGVALLLFFFLSVFLAGKIVAPLEESDRKQRQFISDAGHELKTPISVIGANAELLARELGDNQWLQNVQYENRRLGLLVEQLLDLSRAENAVVKTERVDLSRLVSGEALPFESVAYEKGMQLKTDIENGIFTEGNSDQLKQLVAILLDNGIRHSNACGQIRLTLKADGAMAVLSVVNPAQEIPQEQRRQLFERFYRVDAARNGEDKHYGLGLAIAKAIVDGHHGHAQVLCYDALVEFRILLPVAGEKTEP